VFTIVVLLLANIAMLIFFVGMKEGHKRGDDKNRGPNEINKVLEEKIGFSKQQMQRVKELRHEHWEKMKGRFEDIRQAKIDFYSQLNLPEVQDSALKKSAALIGDKQEAIDLQAFKNIRSIRALCTPEQLPKYDSIMPAAIKNLWFSPRRGNSQNQKDTIPHQNSH
jgi:hypothetical protein